MLKIIIALVILVPSIVGSVSLTKAVSSGRPALGVSWTAPQSDRTIIRYQVQYRIASYSSWSTKNVTSTSTYLENLTAGTRYQVQVRAVSDIGAGVYSNVSILQTYSGLLLYIVL